jgi:hypothetical protein
MSDVTQSENCFHLSKLFWIGLTTLVAGSGPLFVVVAFSSDPNPNPIGPGILCALTFWPAIGMMTAGVILALHRYRSG